MTTFAKAAPRNTGEETRQSLPEEAPSFVWKKFADGVCLRMRLFVPEGHSDRAFAPAVMFFFGGISSVYVGGNDIFEVMINLGLFYLAILVLGLNIWTTNDNALYSAGLGLANIFGQRKKPMVLVSGIIGTVLAVWLYWNFTGWLNILNCTLPPVGIILVMSFFMDREKYKDVEVTENVNWFAVFGVVLGAVVANLVPWGIASINGMIVAAVCYLVGSKAKK